MPEANQAPLSTLSLPLELTTILCPDLFLAVLFSLSSVYALLSNSKFCHF